jgi:hypothetical protein
LLDRGWKEKVKKNDWGKKAKKSARSKEENGKRKYELTDL